MQGTPVSWDGCDGLQSDGCAAAPLPLLGALSAPAVRVGLPSTPCSQTPLGSLGRCSRGVFGRLQHPPPPEAVYPEEVINGHRAFVARRRALRPGEEYRTPTDEKWAEFV